MSIPSIIASNSVKFLSGLSRNEDSLVPMVIKDWIGDGATVYTYKKDGGKDDAKEKAIEEFGTGAVWLFGIPAFKKLFDLTVYKALKLNPDFDIRLLKDNKQLEFSANYLKHSQNEFLKGEKEVFQKLMDPNIAKKYKGLHFAKFITATAFSAVALAKIIKFKQKTTKDRINNEIKNSKKQNASVTLLNKSNKNNVSFAQFVDKAKGKSNNIAFTGIGSFVSEFMFNPVKNTSILDCVIAGTRLKEARHGERKEIVFKEAFQILFIYFLATPIQKMFEKMGSKMNLPIELDPQVIFTKDLAQKIKDAKPDMDNLIKSTKIKEDIFALNPKSVLVELLDKDGAISTIKNKGNIEAISHLKQIDEDKIKSTIENLEKLVKNADNIKGIKAFKTAAVIANVLIVAGMMGIVQPKLNILMRKILNKGDNRNPAIVEQERLAKMQASQA